MREVCINRRRTGGHWFRLLLLGSAVGRVGLALGQVTCTSI